MQNDEKNFGLGYNVLVVDDEEQVAKFISEMLTGKAFNVITLTDSRQALQYFIDSKDSIDLVITDQMMPGLTGLELTKAMLAEKPGLPVFLITGYSEAVDSETAYAAGVREFIEKPLRLKYLVEKLIQHMPEKKL